MKTIDIALPAADPVIQETRLHKCAIAEEFGFDVVALGRSLQERQAHDPRFNRGKVVGTPRQPGAATTRPNL
jgi:hypothetical protein